MVGVGAKEFMCKDKSKCDKKTCLLCNKFDKCSNCAFELNCSFKNRSNSILGPICHTVLW